MEPPSYYNILLTNNEIFVTRGSANSSGDSGPWYAFFVGSSGKVIFEPKATGPPSTAITKRIRAYAIYGIFKLLRGPYLAVATDVKYTAPAPHGGSIYKITKMEWFPVGVAPSRPLTAGEEEEENVYLSLLKLIGDTQSFYFGYNYNIVNSMQRNEKKFIQYK